MVVLCCFLCNHIFVIYHPSSVTHIAHTALKDLSQHHAVHPPINYATHLYLPQIFRPSSDCEGFWIHPKKTLHPQTPTHRQAHPLANPPQPPPQLRQDYWMAQSFWLFWSWTSPLLWRRPSHWPSPPSVSQLHGLGRYRMAIYVILINCSCEGVQHLTL